jgi:tetratricopeptide (TPR) repeat protein
MAQIELDRACYLQAADQIQAGDRQSGLLRLIELAQSNSGYWEVYHDLGRLAFVEGDQEGAVALLETAWQKAGEQGEKGGPAALTLAQFEATRGNFDRALKLYGEILAAVSDDQEALYAVRKIIGQSGELAPTAWARLVAALRTKPLYADQELALRAQVRKLEITIAELNEQRAHSDKTSQLLKQQPDIFQRLTPVAWERLVAEKRCGALATRADTSAARRLAITPAEKIAFLVHSPDLYNHYHRIWQHLGMERIDVIIGEVHEAAGPMRQFYADRGVCAMTLDEARRCGKHYSIMVSNHPFVAGDPEVLTELADYNVRMMYALGKAGWNFASWNSYYDLILCFGPFQAERLSFCQSALKVEVGYPRFDGFFSGEFKREHIERQHNCLPGKKTIVWLPTWSTLSSIRLYAPAIARLSDRYNVVVKPHPLTFKSDPGAVDFLRGLPFQSVIDETIDNIALYVLADYLLCDYGGPMFGGIYVDKNILLLDLPDAGSDALIGDGSADMMVRDVLPHLGLSEIERLDQMLEDESLWREQRAVRSRLRQLFFAPYYGCSSRVAAEVLNNIRHIACLAHVDGT